MTTNAPRRRLPPDARRAQLLDAAASAFCEVGYVRTTIASIADAADVTPRIVYQHYDSKEALYRAVLERTAAILSTVFAEPVGRYGVDAARLMAAARSDEAGFRILWRHAAYEQEFADAAAAVRAEAVSCVRTALSTWTPPEALDFAAQTVVGRVLESVLTMLEYGDERDDARWVRATYAALKAGVQAWAAEPSR